MLSMTVLMVFGCSVFALIGLYSLISDIWLGDRSRLNHRLDEEFFQKERNRLKQGNLFKNLNRLQNEIASKNAKKNKKQLLTEWIEQSGLTLTLGNLVSLMIAVGIFFGCAVLIYRRHVWMVAIGSLIGMLLPPLVINHKRKRRLRTFENQLSGAFETMARMMRAGQPLSQAIHTIAKESAPPLAGEFFTCGEKLNMGLPPEVAFQDLARSIGLMEIKLFALAAQIHQESGGNFAELLDKLAALVRTRNQMRIKVNTLTAESRLQANVLLAIGPILFVTMSIIKKDYIDVLVRHPSLIVTALVFQLFGIIWIRRITKIV